MFTQNEACNAVWKKHGVNIAELFFRYNYFVSSLPVITK